MSETDRGACALCKAVLTSSACLAIQALKYIDIIGRRRILLYSVPGMVIGLVLAAVFFHYLTIDTGGKLDPNVDYQGVWSGLVLFAMVFYVLSYALGECGDHLEATFQY